MNETSWGGRGRPSGRFLVLLLLLGGALAVLCYKGFFPYEAFFANDAALGMLKETSSRLPGTFTGYWVDFWWIGGAIPSSSPTLTSLLAACLSPEHYLKIYAPLTMLFLGGCVWFFFRQLRFAPMVCVMAGLGAGLNMHFFSNACWGLGGWCVCTGMVFVALGIIVSSCIRPLWIKAVLGGLAVGMVVMEGFDVGAIYSVYVGLFVFFYFLATESNKRIGVCKGLGVGAGVVVFAVFIAASTLYTLVGTQLKGTTNGGMIAEDKAYRWGFTTQWSIPKLESLRVIIPGVFGYRMAEFMTSTNKDSAYWGSVAEDPHIQQLESGDPDLRRAAAKSLGLPPELQDKMASASASDRGAQQSILDQLKGMLQRRHSGSGEYVGVLMCLLAAFAIASAARRNGTPYSRAEALTVWFWTGAAVVSLLAAWGRFGFVYPVIYQLPFFSDIRNPMKFMHPLNVSLIILAGYGLEALFREHLQGEGTRAGGFFKNLRPWWKSAAAFDKKWVVGCVIVLALCGVGFLIMSSSQTDLTQYLEHNGFGEDVAPRMTAFSLQEVELFILFFALSMAVVIGIVTNGWMGRKAVWAWALLGAIMIVDLGRSDAPWIRYFNYKQKYSINPVVDFLKNGPWEHRVASRFSPVPAPYDLVPGMDTGSPDNNVGALCHWWLENDYPYRNIECLELDQAPRMPILDSSYINNFNARNAADVSAAAVQWAQTNNPQNSLFRWVIGCGPAARMWRLTNTRYIFGSADFVAVANRYVDPPNSFRTLMRLEMDYKPGIVIPEDAGDLTVNKKANGPLALMEFTAALPRAKLYSHWRQEDDSTALRTLNSPQFDPFQTVLIATNTPVAQTAGPSDADPGTVNITKYHPKDIVLSAQAKTPAVLLLNDRTGDFWSVTVDQKPADLLRCNYIMRGVFLPAGPHTVEFRYAPPLKFLYISAAALAIGVLLGGFVAWSNFSRREPV